MDEPRPLPLLGDIRMDPDQGRGECQERKWEWEMLEEGARGGKQLEGEERIVILHLLFLEEGEEGPTAPSFPHLSDLAG